ETGLLRDKPGFEVQFMTRTSCLNDAVSHDLPSVLMPVRGHWKISWDSGETTLAPGDTMSIPEGMQHTVTPSMTGEAALYRVLATQDPAGLTWIPKS
ncbi:MAG: cupin, partial [Rhodobacteraceae bacterium]|nr:cupin [Paracoccaceae bacterium]